MFQVGDKVVCVDAGERFGPLHFEGDWQRVKVGGIYEIVDIADMPDDGIGLILDIDDPSDGGAWEADRFRKIQPCEPEFIELLKRIKPKVDA